MKTIKAYTKYDENRDIRYYRDFKIIDELPSIGEKDFGYEGTKVIDIYPVTIDCDQGNDEVYNYEYFEIIVQNNNDLEKDTLYVAIEKEFEEEASEDEVIVFEKEQFKDLCKIFNINEKEKKITSAKLDTNNNVMYIYFDNNDKYKEYLDNDKFFETLRIAQYAEAEERLKLLNLHPNVLKEFKEDRTIYYSERQNKIFDGILYYIDNVKEYKEAIEEFEERTHALVYHAQLTKFEFGTCLSLLYISRLPYQWEEEKESLTPDDKGIMYPYVYVVNLDDPDCSEHGIIGIVTKNGGISRVY